MVAASPRRQDRDDDLKDGLGYCACHLLKGGISEFRRSHRYMGGRLQ